MTEHEYMLVVGKERVDAAREMLKRAVFAEDVEGEAFQQEVQKALRRLDKLSKKLHDAVQMLPDEDDEIDIGVGVAVVESKSPDKDEDDVDPESVTYIDRHNYPAIFTMCTLVLQDNGGVNRVDTPDGVVSLVFLLPAHPASGFGHMEAALLDLAANESDWQQFATGEDSVAQAIASRDPQLVKLHDILNRWFDQGMPVA